MMAFDVARLRDQREAKIYILAYDTGAQIEFSVADSASRHGPTALIGWQINGDLALCE